MIKNPIPMVNKKKKATCKRTIKEFPLLKTNAKIIMAITSLITRTVYRANPTRVESKSISDRIRIAMVVDVAKKIVPITAHCSVSILKRSPTIYPRMKGITIPKMPTKKPVRLVFFNSPIFISNPAVNKRKITPMKAISLNSGDVKSRLNLKNDVPKRLSDVPERDPMSAGPRTMPAMISPMTPGCFIFSKRTLKIFAKIIARVISSNIPCIP